MKERTISFSSLEEKARWLDAAASLDANLKIVRDLAQRYAGAVNPNEHERLARGLHQFVRDGVRYVHDPGHEEFADSGVILRRGFDDCDGKARLFVALCRVVGLEARIRPVFRAHPNRFVHVQAEVRWPGSQSVKGAAADGWILAELILKGCELGQDPDTVALGPDGRRVLS